MLQKIILYLYPDAGWYHYTYSAMSDEVKVVGPYRTYSSAEGPLVGARVYFVSSVVNWHYHKPYGASPVAGWMGEDEPPLELPDSLGVYLLLFLVVEILVLIFLLFLFFARM